MYPVLLGEEMLALEDAAVKLITDFVDQKPGPPEDDTEPAAAVRYKAAMAQAAANACELLAVLCTKRPPLVERLWEVFAEAGQDEDVKVCCRCCSRCATPPHGAVLVLRSGRGDQGQVL